MLLLARPREGAPVGHHLSLLLVPGLLFFYKRPHYSKRPLSLVVLKMNTSTNLGDGGKIHII